jgi:hypothetical protein
MDDIRIPVNFFFHKKTLALFERFGDHGYVSLVRLFIFARVNRSTGDLSGIPDDQLEFMAMWKGEKGAFISALVEFGLADRGTDGSTRLHNWSKHQSWAIGAPKRSEAASVAARAKWEKELERKINAARNADGNTEGNAQRIEVASKPHDAPILSPPLLSSPPLPSPNLTLPLLTTEGVQGDLVPPATPTEHKVTEEKPKQEDPDALRVYEHYNSTIDTSHKPSKPQTISNIKSLIKKLMLGSDHIGKKRSQVADYLIEVVNRYKASAVYEKADRQYRFKQSNFWGEKAEWHNYKDEQENIETKPFEEETVYDRIRARDLRHAEECRAEFTDGRDCMAVYGCGQDRCYVCPVQLEKWSGAEQARAMRRLQNP